MRYVKYKIEELLHIKEYDFLSALFLHTEKRALQDKNADDEEKINSWKDCLSFIKQYLMSYTGLAHILQVPVCFEYEIFDGTWVDAVIVCRDKLIILFLRVKCVVLIQYIECIFGFDMIYSGVLD